MLKQLLEKIDSAKIVSFDMFDTLIYRIYDEPVDLFAHLGETWKCPDFKKDRILAEMKLRDEYNRQGIHEVTLSDIYDRLGEKYQAFFKYEKQLEIMSCRTNGEMKAAFDYAKEKGKKVVISSDMYLPLDVIQETLRLAGYTGYDKLFLSSETKRPKSTGEMYEDLLDYVQEPANSVLHIGDHPFADKEMAEKKGLSAFLYMPFREKGGKIHSSSYFAVLNKYDNKSVLFSLIRGLIGAKSYELEKKSYWYQFGYKYAGIIAYAYMHWLHEKIVNNKIEHVFFMLRDGYIFKKVFESLYPDIHTEEILGSRRLFMFAGAKRVEDIDLNLLPQNSKDLYLIRGLTYENLFSRLELDSEMLAEKYKKVFPEQNEFINSYEDVVKVQDFFLENVEILLECGKKERKTIIRYFDNIGLFNEKCGIVDLGWKGSMLKGIERLCSISGKTADLVGYYLGTHRHTEGNFTEEAYIISQGKAERFPEKALNDSYVVNILELMFSAPHPSIMKISEDDNGYYPVYQHVIEDEQKRIDTSRFIMAGVLEFVKDIDGVLKQLPLKIPKEVACAPLEYFASRISKYDEMQLQTISFFPGVGSDTTCFPISKHTFMNMGIVNPWPGDESAESELVLRIQKAAHNVGIGCTILDSFGCVLDSRTQEKTPDIVNTDMLDFVLTTHYESHKSVDAFYYHALWNPPEIPLNLEYYSNFVTNNYLSNDDFLIYDSGGMRNHLQSILMNKPRDIEGASILTGSFPASEMLEPNLHNPKMFYCGMNWEKVVYNSNRHEGLFKLLDKTGKVKFFGPDVVKAWGGLKPWEGYECYQYSIPFDGFSILKEINKCGICLVISSDIHRRAGAVTNRAYEACAAGAVIISDENEYMKEYFSGAALFINYNKNNPQDTYRQIMEKYQWIVTHPDDALDLARKAQMVFKEHFGLEKQLLNIVKRHPIRFASIASDLFAKDDGKTVLVSYVLNSQNLEDAKGCLDKIIKNIHNQYYKEIVLAIAVDWACAKEVEVYLKDKLACVKVEAMELFDKKGSRKITDGQAIRYLQKRTPHDYFMNTNASEYWYYDHVTTLVRAIEDDESLGAYSGRLLDSGNGYPAPERFDVYTKAELASMNDINAYDLPGHFLFVFAAHVLVPDYMFGCLDGLEQYAYANLIAVKFNKKLSFSRRITIIKKSDSKDKRYSVVPSEMQIRLIQDAVRFELKEDANAVCIGGNTGGGINDIGCIKDVIMGIPVKWWLRLRYYKIRARMAGFDSENGRKYMSKYNRLYQTVRASKW